MTEASHATHNDVIRPQKTQQLSHIALSHPASYGKCEPLLQTLLHGEIGTSQGMGRHINSTNIKMKNAAMIDPFDLA